MKRAGMDEDDYMSDLVLTECCKAESNKNDTKRIKKFKTEQPNAVSRKEMETQRREEGLNCAIPPENKGFQLLKKMGYKQNCGLGKNGNGISEPITIEMKVGRKGLGHGVHLKKVTSENRRKYENLWMTNIKEKYNEKQVERDLISSQRVCEKLDFANNIGNPKLNFFWPTELVTEDDSEEDACDKDEAWNSAHYKLMEVTDYLRSTYYYCVWCGVKYNDVEDLRTSCPGNTYADHE